MVHKVHLFVDDIHFGIAILCEDGWYKFEYAAGGASGLSASSGHSGSIGAAVVKTCNAVTIKTSAPTGFQVLIGLTSKGLQAICDYARGGSGFHNSLYGVTDNNCRVFCARMAKFMGVHEEYKKFVISKGYLFALEAEEDLI